MEEDWEKLPELKPRGLTEGVRNSVIKSLVTAERLGLVMLSMWGTQAL